MGVGAVPSSACGEVSEPEREDRCYVSGREATLVPWAQDYDGGNKAWVRFGDGTDAIIGGSRVERR